MPITTSKITVAIALFALSFSCYGQDDEKKETVFITSEIEKPKKKDNRRGEYEHDRWGTYLQSAFSLGFTPNPDYGETTENEDEKQPFLIPDGFSAHIGIGQQFQQWVGVGINTGLDWSISEKLVSLPLYASVFLNPHLNDETSVFLQAGYGRAFALGQPGSGTYQKYRLGLLCDGLLFFADVSMYGYGPHGNPDTGSISFGISVMDFFEKK